MTGLTKADGELVGPPDLLKDLEHTRLGLGVPHPLSVGNRVGRVQTAPWNKCQFSDCAKGVCARVRLTCRSWAGSLGAK